MSVSVKRKILGVAVFILVIFAGFAAGYYLAANRPVVVYQLLPETEQHGTATVWLVIEHRDSEGRLKQKVVKEGDPFTQNFAKFIQFVFDPRKNTNILSLTGTSGSSGTLQKGPNGCSSRTPFADIDKAEPIVSIQIGTGSEPFGVSNYSLSSYLMETGISNPTLAINGDQMNVSFSATFSFDASYTISECGVVVTLNTVSETDGSYLFLRDLISPAINVNNGDTLTITYIIQLNG